MLPPQADEPPRARTDQMEFRIAAVLYSDFLAKVTHGLVRAGSRVALKANCMTSARLSILGFSSS